MSAAAFSALTVRPLRELAGLTEEFHANTYKNVAGRPAFGITPILMRSNSRGRIMFKSKNPFHWPRMEANYFDDPQDMKRLVAGIELGIRLTETKGFKKFGAKLNKNPYYGCEGKKFRSDEYWECCLRLMGSTLQHQVGTCKMGPTSDLDAVVDPELMVHGIKNLRVMDASIMPVIPASHTNSVAQMIGEKGTDMVKVKWGKSTV